MCKGLVLLLLLVAVGLPGCLGLTTAPVQPPHGAIYTRIRAPLTVNYHNTKVADTQAQPATEEVNGIFGRYTAKAAGCKVGTASTTYLSIPLWYISLDFAWDRCDIETAAKQGGLQKVHYADYEVEEVLGIFGRFTVRAYGE